MKWQPSKRMKQGSVVALLATNLIGGFEGVRQHAYPDPATRGPPWTICFGHTEGVKPGDFKTMQECKDLFVKDLAEYAGGIEACVHVPLPDARFVALTSFAYNLGVVGACRSRVVALLNAGHVQEGCNALLAYNRAAGIVFPGLTRRRQKEREFCLRDT